MGRREPRDVDKAMAAMDAEMLSAPHEYPDNKGGVLYHYTTAAGLVGIIRSQSVWATDYRHLNDRKEMDGERIITEELSKIVAACSPTDDGGATLELLEAVLKYFSDHPPSRLFHICVASFTTQGDQLSQWRGYAQSGYAIGIRTRNSALPQTHIPGAAMGVGLVKCIYEETELRKRVRSIMKKSVKVLRRYARDPQRSYADRARLLKNGVTNCLVNLGGLAPRYKDRGFREEQEYRIVALVDTRHPQKRDAIQFRATPDGRLVPYVVIPMQNKKSQLPLASLCLGPTHDPVQAESAARLMLECHGYDASVVTRSRVPFRG